MTNTNEEPEICDNELHALADAYRALGMELIAAELADLAGHVRYNRFNSDGLEYANDKLRAYTNHLGEVNRVRTMLATSLSTSDNPPRDVEHLQEVAKKLRQKLGS